MFYFAGGVTRELADYLKTRNVLIGVSHLKRKKIFSSLKRKKTNLG
jgi:hypothetical protein